jgi:hypothetical protein
MESVGVDFGFGSEVGAVDGIADFAVGSVGFEWEIVRVRCLVE